MTTKYYNPRDILVIEKIPELDWLKDLATALKETGSPDAEKMELLYKYMLWSRRYALSPDEKVRRVCYGFVIKYHRPLWDMENEHPTELNWIAEAEAALELSNRAIRARREGAESRAF